MSEERKGGPSQPGGRGRPRQVDDPNPSSSVDREVVRALRAARIDAGLTQERLAERLGVTQSRVSTFERGHVVPDVPMLERWAAALDLRLVVSLESVEEANESDCE